MNLQTIFGRSRADTHGSARVQLIHARTPVHVATATEPEPRVPVFRYLQASGSAGLSFDGLANLSRPE